MKWIQELGTNITTSEELKEVLPISNEQVLKLDAILEQYPMSVNRYYLSLIDFNNPNDPILKLCIPSAS
ncbi:MAG: KamA family radical SAM protein, partial [Anaerotignaceae bacterium]